MRCNLLRFPNSSGMGPPRFGDFWIVLVVLWKRRRKKEEEIVEISEQLEI